MKTAQNYVAPEVSVLEVAIETGFAGSTEVEATSSFSLKAHDVIDME